MLHIEFQQKKKKKSMLNIISNFQYKSFKNA